jgi:hypothetical protein
MKQIQIVPLGDKRVNLKTLLNDTERKLRGGRTTFVRKKAGKWIHVRYSGWISWDLAKGGVIEAKVHSKEGSEWQLLQAFIGYVDRHIGRYVKSINIIYK